MTTTFPRTKRSALGYDVSQVEAFLELARAAYDADSLGSTRLSSSDIRQASFAMHKGGYSCRHVDSALERLELAFSRRERDRAIDVVGTQAWVEAGQARLDVLLARFARPAKHRFNRVSLLSRGYSIKDVDAFVDLVSAAGGESKPFAADQVRAALFRSSFGGYNETQVDLVLDGLLDVLIAVGTD